MATRAQEKRADAIVACAAIDTKTYFAERAARLRAGVLERLRDVHIPLTATMLRQHLDCGMRELDKVLQQLRKDGLIQSHRRYWVLVP